MQLAEQLMVVLKRGWPPLQPHGESGSRSYLSAFCRKGFEKCPKHCEPFEKEQNTNVLVLLDLLDTIFIVFLDNLINSPYKVRIK